MNTYSRTGIHNSISYDSNEIAIKNMQQLSPSDSENSDIEFDDTQLQTPQALRESSRSILERATTTEIPLSDHPSQIKKKTPTKFADFTDHEVIVNEKLISDDNQFTPHALSGSPGRIPRLQWSNEKIKAAADILQNKKDLSDDEFDPSEDDEPSNKKPKAATEDEPPIISESLKSTLARSPRKGSPLRNEIRPSSSSPSDTHGDNSGEPKKIDQMLRLMNSDLNRLRSIDLDDAIDEEQDHVEYDEQSESSDDNEEAMRKLDTLLPSRSSRAGNLSPLRAALFSIDSIENKGNRTAPSLTAPETVEANAIWGDRSPTRNGKLVGAKRKRMNAKSLRLKGGKNSIVKPPKKEYAAWPAEKWTKLTRLIELSIPNEVIVNSNIVVRELGCNNKAELAKRVEFLENYLNEDS